MRMKIIIPVFLLISALFSCGKEEPELPALTVDQISGERLWERITRESRYESYAQWPDHQGLRPGQSPHGVKHRIFINRTLYEAVPAEQAPEGSILVKENYNAAGNMVKLTVMAKVRGYDPEKNDWFWAAIDPDGTVSAEGSPRGCISCHEGMKDNDYVIVQPLDMPLP